jgi:hypothetical protein
MPGHRPAENAEAESSLPRRGATSAEVLKGGLLRHTLPELEVSCGLTSGPPFGVDRRLIHCSHFAADFLSREEMHDAHGHET